jgi:hypothetical protein
MTTEIQATIQALAAVESLTNEIDTLAVLDRQVKDLTATCKKLKDSIANTYGDGKFRGEKYGVSVTIANVKGSVDYEALCKSFGITEEKLNEFRKESISRITVTSTI